MEIKEKVVVVTGSSRGFGLAIAVEMVKKGAKVIVTGRSPEALEKAVKMVSAHGAAEGHLLDVSEAQQVYALAKKVSEKYGRLDIWINNAGYSSAAGRMIDFDPQEALDMFRANDLGVFHGTQAALHFMLPRKAGMLVNIYGAGSFLNPSSPTGLYAATKAWIASFTRTLAVEIKGSGVQLLGFSPGMMLTDMLTSPTVIGAQGQEMMKNFGFVLRFLGKSPEAAAQELVKAIEGQRKEFAEVRMFKPWTPMLGLLRVGWENLTKTGKKPEYALKYEEPYKLENSK
jgi:NAD(P)-dependent dehydrogenase (short-subunit alcohol dehydrogenase family)